MFIQSRVARDYSLGTTDANETWLLPTNPISHLLISIRALTAAANVVDSVISLASQLLSIQVRFRGAQIWAASGDDLARLVNTFGCFTPMIYCPAIADNSPRQLTLCLPFGRRLYNLSECFPATNAGELELYISWDAVTTNYDNVVLDISTIEVPEAKPTQFVRVTTQTDTPSATGDKDYDLPRLAPVAGIGIFQTASYPTSSTPTINTLKVLLNNIDTGYTDLDMRAARDVAPSNQSASMRGDSFVQQTNSAGAYAQYALSIGQHTLQPLSRDWAYLDYDPALDGKHLLMGAGSTSLKMRINFGATSAIRLLPVELFPPSLLPGRK